MVNYASQKAGTSPASRQWESDYGGVFIVVTDCAKGRCVATASGGQETVEQDRSPALPIQLERFELDDQLRLDLELPPRRRSAQAAQPRDVVGVLRATARRFPAGSWHTDIETGPCRGSVIMPIAAFPR